MKRIVLILNGIKDKTPFLILILLCAIFLTSSVLTYLYEFQWLNLMSQLVFLCLAFILVAKHKKYVFQYEKLKIFIIKSEDEDIKNNSNTTPDSK
jgi:positive regulator of sigma E activity